jgi:hypothetical protein
MNRKAKRLMVIGWLMTGFIVTGICAAILFAMLSARSGWYRATAVGIPFLFFVALWIRRGIELRSLDASPNNAFKADVAKATQP